MDQRRKFIEAWLADECGVSALCVAFGISRKTGYKWIGRFKQGGLVALADESRAHTSHPATTSARIEAGVVDLRRQHPFWGPRKLKARLARVAPQESWPCPSTIGEILKRHGLVQARRIRHRTPAFAGPRTQEVAPNDVWRADFKGWFRTKDGVRIDPLTVTDGASHKLMRCQALDDMRGPTVQAQFTAMFQEFGLPKVMRTDNGTPFASVGLGGLTALGVWLLRLGITPERIRPGHPEDNGSHERMHRDLKAQTANPPRANRRAQQLAFAAFQASYNGERPHESIGMLTPDDVYACSNRPFPRKLPEMMYPDGSTIRKVTDNGTLQFQGKRIYLSNALMWEPVRIEENEGYDVWYGPLLLGTLDLEREIIKQRPTKVSPMIPV